VLEGSASGVGPILKADDNEFMRFFSDQFTGNDFDGNGQEIAIYEKVLTPERVMAHYVAGSQRGWPRMSTGSRVLDVVTSPLWVETGIQGGLFPVPPDMMVGQSRASVIEDMVAIEGPNAMFFFGDDGAPRFLDYDNRDVVGSSRNSPQATFGNGTGEQPFVDVDLAYDNLIYNQVTVMGVSGVEQYAEDADSIVEFGERPMPPLDLPVDGDTYALTMAQTLVAVYAWPQYIVKSIDLDGTGPSSVRSQMLLRDLGDCIRVKVRPTGGSQVPIDHVGWIIGIHRTLERETGRLTATFYLSRGFDSGDGLWHAGVGGFSEADLTTVAA
jgi:hypothetical protein